MAETFHFCMRHEAHEPLTKDWQDIEYLHVSTVESEFKVIADSRNKALKMLLDWTEELNWESITDVDKEAEWVDDDWTDDEPSFERSYDEDGTFDDWGDDWD